MQKHLSIAAVRDHMLFCTQNIILAMAVLCQDDTTSDLTEDDLGSLTNVKYGVKCGLWGCVIAWSQRTQTTNLRSARLPLSLSTPYMYIYMYIYTLTTTCSTYMIVTPALRLYMYMYIQVFHCGNAVCCVSLAVNSVCVRGIL